MQYITIRTTIALGLTLTVAGLAACSPGTPTQSTPSPSASASGSATAALPSPSPSPSASPSPSPTPVIGSVTNWNGTVVRQDGRQAGVSLRLQETAQPNGTIALKGIWTLIGDFQETTAVNGYRQGDDWTLITTLGDTPVQFNAMLLNRRLTGDLRGLQTSTPLGTLDLTLQ
jgi:hypothetical protein